MTAAKIAAFAVAAMLVAGCSSSTGSTAAESTAAHSSTTKPATAASGVESPIETIPWAQVGPGWTLATWSPVAGTLPGESPPPGQPTYETASTTLYLVDPAGGRYPIVTFPPPGDKASPQLVDWSGDGTDALFYAAYTEPPSAIIVDLHTGAQSSVPVDGAPRFTRPTGKALLVTTEQNGPKPATLARVDLAGRPQLTYSTDKLGSPFDGHSLSTPDGTTLVLGSTAGLASMGNDGSVGSSLQVPGQTRCSPVRWWDAPPSTVLASCDVGGTDASRLWLVPVDGDPPTALTAPNDHQNGPDYADMTAWRLPAGTFVQAAGACGVILLTKLNANGSTTPITVPDTNTDGSIRVLGVHGGDLTLKASHACGPGEALVDYDPAANTSTVLLGPPVNGGGVIDAVPYP